MGQCGHDFRGGDMVVGHLAGCRLQCASFPDSTVCPSSRGSRGRLRDCRAAQCEGHRAPADQVAALCWAVVLFAVGLHIGFYYFWLTERSWGLWASYLLVPIGGLSGPIAIGIAILRYRLYDIDILINRTLVYGSLTATLVALYFGGIVVLQRFFVLLTGQQSTLAVVASTLVIAA